ncbi:uncharacterized protein LOC143027016 isoform X2 [Oratosquilla oratoria]|uniref:uncharacterized protein LOC143027016 isoform X2 n=1 Tax=Oratosquilla oratoria TaxID=337810 RepID=UPI003F7630E2
MSRRGGPTGEDNDGFDVEENNKGAPSPTPKDLSLHVTKSRIRLVEDPGTQDGGVVGSTKTESSVLDYFRPNRKLVLIKMHFFSGLMGSAPIWIFLTLIIRQRGISLEGIGLLWTMLFVVGVVSGSLLITIIDFFKLHRASFIISAIVTPIALSMIYWTPHVNSNHGFDNRTVSANGTFRYNLNDDVHNCSQVHETNGQVSLNEMELLRNSSIVSLPVGGDERDHDSRPNTSNCSVLNRTSLKDKELLVSELVKQPKFWLLMTFILVASLGALVSNNITDSTCFKLLGKDSHQYGQQRLFGAVAFGLCALMTGALIDAYSANLPEKDYFPAFVVVAVCSLIDVVVVAKIKVPDVEMDEGFSLKSLLQVIISPTSVLFFMTVFVLSTSHHILSTFHLVLVEEVADAWRPNFPFLKTLQGLVIAVRCFLGEIPLFIISGKPTSGMVGGLLWSWFGGHGMFLVIGIFLAFYLFICSFVSLILSRFRRFKEENEAKHNCP